MEVRVEKKRGKFPHRVKKPNIPWKILLAGLAVCLIAGGLVWRFGGESAQADDASINRFRTRYNMDTRKDPATGTTKAVFRILEVVPDKKQAVLGFFIGGQENKLIDLGAISDLIKNDTTETYKTSTCEYRQFFSWEGKEKGGREPFSIVMDADNKISVVNNEVFKLHMLGIGSYDEQKSLYDNLMDASNQNLLKTFDEQFIIEYEVLTARELSAKFDEDNTCLDHIQYLHIGDGVQIQGLGALYKAVVKDPTFNGNKKFAENNDITKYNGDGNVGTYDIIQKIYERTLSSDNRLALSFNISNFYDEKGKENNDQIKLNIFKLYAALNYFDDPRNFQEFYLNAPSNGNEFREGMYIDLSRDEHGKWIGYYIDNKKNGNAIIHGEDQTWSWDVFDQMWKVKGASSYPDVGKINEDSARRPGNYTPTALDNILLYSWYSGKENKKEFMEDRQNIFAIHQILNPGIIPTPDNPDEEEDGSVKVLEIEPCNVYWFSDKDENQQNRENLAHVLGVNEKELSVTCVTPNRLNGMAVDLVAEYDLIYIGDNTSLFRAGSDFNNPQNMYRHIGTINDAVIPQTLINGLLEGDYTTESRFNEVIGKKTPGAKLNIGSYLPSKSNPLFWNPKLREQLGTLSGSFLKNVDLSLELQSLGVEETVSKARFSGNDLTRYMQTQLAEFVRSGQPVIVTKAVNQEAGKRYWDCVGIDLGDKELEPSDEKSRQDARLYLGLCGVDGGLEDERKYYKDKKLPITIGAAPADTIRNIYIRENTVDKIEGHVDLLKRFKPEIRVRDVQSENGEETGVQTILEKGAKGKSLDSLNKSNRLSFKYEITLPEGITDFKKCVMKIIVDENGDGIFDSEGEGKTTVNGKKGSQNNAADMIKNDKVFEYDFSDPKLQPGIDYEYEAGNPGKISGTWIANESVDAIDEFCQFRVVVTVKDNLYKLRGAWTGYMRPELEQKKVNILQIMPYSDKMKGVPLSKNKQFRKLIQGLGEGREFIFDFDNGFTAMSEGDFTMACAGGEITAESLKAYDLIIVGTDFSPDISEDLTDMKDEKATAVTVLKEYTAQLKRPIIFTNDAFSYVNSENYVAPEETKYHYRNLTLEEYKIYKDQLKTDTTGKFKKVPIKASDYMGQKTINEAADKQEEDGNGTAYLEPDYKTITKIEDLPYYNVSQSGSYKAIMVPITEEMAKDGRVANDSVFLGNEALWGIGGGGLKVKDINGTERNVSLANVNSLLPSMVDSRGWFLNEYYYIREGYITAKELRNLYESTESLGPVRIPWGPRCSFYRKDLYPVLQTTETISADSVNADHKITIAGKEYYEFSYNNKNYLAIQTQEETREYYGYIWKIKVEGSGEDQLTPTYALTDVAGKSGALYPSKNNWNYFMTQSLRYAVGMDRFAVTTDMLESVDDMKSSNKIEDVKRDKGSSRRWAKVKEIQGFTDGALLEFAYLPPEGSALTGLSNISSPYASISLGTKPRTDCIEKLNGGVIGHYPYEISDPQNTSETRIPIVENHPPYYQLDLEREVSEGKIDDVTVWYTLTDSNDVKMKDISSFFDTTRLDAGNNYYLYSKGKTYYTGISLHDEKGDSAIEGDDDLVPDMEMKLFINTIYAALTSGAAKDPSYYETTVQTGGTISQISAAGKLGDSNRYVCYYDEYGADAGTAVLDIPFHVLEKNAKAGEPGVTVAIGLKSGTAGSGAPEINALASLALEDPAGNRVEVTGNKYSAITVVKVPGDPGTNPDPGAGEWYRIKIPVNLATDALDGKTLVIGPVTQPTDPTNFLDNAIYAEVRLVKRDLFDLD